MDRHQKKIEKFPLLNAILFSLFIIIGYNYDKTGTIGEIVVNFKHFIFVLVSFGVLSFLFYQVLKKIYHFLDNYMISKEKNNKLISFIFYKHPFISMFVLCFVASTLYLIFFYPGTMAFDGNWQLNSYLEYWEWNNHHPALLSIIMGSILKFGSSIINDNFGIFLFIGIQVIVNALVFGYALSFLNKIEAPIGIRVVVFLFFGLFPFWTINSITYIKDTLYYLVLLFIFLYTYYHFEFLKDYQIKTFIILTLLYFVLYLLRNTGLYVGVLSLLVLFVINIKSKKRCRGFLLVLVLLVLFHEGYHKIFLPKVEAKEASPREMLSVPLQQTGRYLKYYYAELTDKEEKNLKKLFKGDLEEIGKDYNPNRSDEVKSKTKDYPKSKDLKSYFQAWFSMFLKHPLVYVDATLNNVYAYFYSEHKNFVDEEIGFYIITNKNPDLDIHFNKLENGRLMLEDIATSICNTPIIGLLYSCYIYTWALFTLTFYILYKKKYKLLGYLMPIYVTFLLCLISPVNGHMRYFEPIVVMLPFAYAILLNKYKFDKKQGR